MWGLPYDDVDGWRGPYPREVYAAQFEKMAARWKDGVEELRDALAKASDAPAEERRRLKKEIRQILESEIALAREQYALVCEDSRIGFEPSCQYFYMPLDLLEKVVNCRWLQEKFADYRCGDEIW